VCLALTAMFMFACLCAVHAACAYISVTQTAAPDVSSVVSFISASHGHVVSAVQVRLSH
jgi:hypothetical protein